MAGLSGTLEPIIHGEPQFRMLAGDAAREGGPNGVGRRLVNCVNCGYVDAEAHERARFKVCGKI